MQNVVERLRQREEQFPLKAVTPFTWQEVCLLLPYQEYPETAEVTLIEDGNVAFIIDKETVRLMPDLLWILNVINDDNWADILDINVGEFYDVSVQPLQ